MATIGITGGTGLVGNHLIPLLLSKGHEVVIFTRHIAGKTPGTGCTYAQWDAEKQVCDAGALQKLNAVIHLAGEPVAAKRWTKQQKQKIRDSRVVGTRFLVEQLKTHAPNCRTFIGASGMGFYGPDNGTPFTETQPAANDFLGETSREWEAEEQKAADFLHTVIFRFSIVLAKEGGAFPKFVQPLSFGIMPILGGGKQILSWIHVDDLARLLLFALENTDIQGTYNAATATPLTNRQLMKEIATAKGGLHIPIPVPSFLLKLALGEMSIEVLKSCTVSATKTLETGFVFGYPEISGALKDLLAKKPN